MSINLRFRSSLALLVGAVGLLYVTAAHAAVHQYEISDHPGGNLTQHGFSYGLRLDGVDRVFSFNQGDGTTLTYDDVANTASIVGTMRESLGNGLFGTDLFNLSYTMSLLTGAGPGSFTETNGTGAGTLSFGSLSYSLGAAANNSGDYFLFADDDHRLTSAMGLPADTWVGRGWVSKDAGTRGMSNDFLFTARQVATVPLPMAGLLLLASLGGLGALQRRKQRVV